MRRRSSPRGSHNVANAVAQFVLAGMLALAVLSISVALLLRHSYRAHEVGDVKEVARTSIRRVVETNLSEGLLHGDLETRSRFDQVVRSTVLNSSVEGLALLESSGRVVYSDISSEIGTLDEMRPAYVKDLRNGGVMVTTTAADDPDDRLRIAGGGLMEATQWVMTPNGQPLLLKSYMKLAAVNASAREILVSSAPAFLGALILLELVQLPLALSLARGVRDARQKEEALLRRAIESSATERRRIASDLHDGVVQDLAAINLGLTAAIDQLDASSGVAAAALRDAAAATRKSIGVLRTLVVDIYPPNLEQVGLGAALRDMVGPLSALGIVSSLVVSDELTLPSQVEAVMFRTAQEAVRNVTSHARATHVTVTVTRDIDSAVLEVSDDGRGFVLADQGPAVVNGHLGLRLLADLAADAGAALTIKSTVGAGTRVRLEVPL